MLGLGTSLVGERTVGQDFSPGSIAGLALWLDASDSSTLLNAASEGSPAAPDDPVFRWLDKSGNRNDAVQTTLNQCGLRRTAAQHGLDVVEFDGSNDNMIANIPQIAGVQPVIFVVWKYSAAEVISYGALFEHGGAGARLNAYFVVLSTSFDQPQPMLFRNLTDLSGSVNVAPINACNVLAYQTLSASEDTNYKLGGCWESAFTMGDPLRLSEMLIYSAPPSIRDVQKLIAYLMAKWGVSQ